MARGALLAVVAFTVAACSTPTPTSTPAFYYSIDNAGGPPVTVLVNGVEVGHVDCLTSISLDSDPRVPPRPWDIEFRRPNGQPVEILHVDVGSEPGVLMIREYGGFALEFHPPGSSGGPAPPTACVTWPTPAATNH